MLLGHHLWGNQVAVVRKYFKSKYLQERTPTRRAATPKRGMVSHFCECGDTQERLAVLGVLSQDTAENAALRTANRDTWMRHGTQSGILSLFVMRGVGLSARALQEARAHGDTVFVSAPSTTSYKTVRQQCS